MKTTKNRGAKLKLVEPVESAIRNSGFKEERYEIAPDLEKTDRDYPEAVRLMNQMFKDEISRDVSSSIAWIAKGVPAIVSHVYNEKGYSRLAVKFEATERIRERMEARYGKGTRLYGDTICYDRRELAEAGPGALQYITYDTVRRQLSVRIERYRDVNDDAARAQMSRTLAEMERLVNS
jgi:hypothetical protein